MPTYRLPWPPTNNTYYRRAFKNGKQITYISEAGKKYRIDVLAAVLEQGRKHFDGKLHLVIEMHQTKGKCDMDNDNAPKSVQDSLAHAGVFDNDRQICHLEVIRCEPSESRGYIEVTVERIG
jgi:crossover junction endodeoxyribonuclease RusA